MNDHTDEFELRLRSLSPRSLGREAEVRLDAALVRAEQVSSPLPWVAAAALLVVALLVFLVWPRTIELVPSWAIQPAPDAEFRIVGPYAVELSRGELEFRGSGQSGEITIQTPTARISASKAVFFVGAHSERDRMNDLFTRALVVTGSLVFTTAQGTIVAEEGELVTAEANSPAVKTAVASQSRFAVDLYRKLAARDAGNLFCSPFSISVVLSMIAEGARGETAAELGRALHFPESARRVGDDAQRIPWETARIHSGLKELTALLQREDSPELAKIRAAIDAEKTKLDRIRAALVALRGTGGREYFAKSREERESVERLNELLVRVDQYQLRVANGLFLNDQFRPNPQFVDIMTSEFGSRMETLDFGGAPAASADHINDWVSDITEGEIRRIVGEGHFGEATAMALVNAIYFAGHWQKPFPRKRTEPREFTLPGGDTVDVATMYARRLEGLYAAVNADGALFDTPAMIAKGRTEGLYPEDDGIQLLEIPYKGGDVSMVLLVPRSTGGLGKLEARLNADDLDRWIGALAKRKVEAYVPRFELESSFELRSTLEALGVSKAFTRESDLSGMAASGGPPLFLSAVLHRAVVRVDEEGTVAAAVTAAVPTGAKLPVEELVPFTPIVRADRPFLFVIRERTSGAILFVGRVADPR